MPHHRLSIFVLTLTSLAYGCAGGEGPRTGETAAPAASGPERAMDERGAEGTREEGYAMREMRETVRPADPELARRVDGALERVLTSGERDGVSILAECGDDGALTEVRIFGSGVGIWNRNRQFTLPAERVTALLERFREIGFSRFQELYGTIEQEIPVPEDVGGAALRVICRVELTLDGVTKQSGQLDEGPRSEELKELADSILELGREPGTSGTTADGLDDGLAKIAAGTLAPEVLRVLLHRKPDARAVAAGETGFLLRIEGARATVQPYTGSYGDAVEIDLTRPELAELAAHLAENRPGDLPLNLYANHYTDLVVEVLDRKREIQARTFTGITPSTHGEAQERFDRIYDRLAEVAREPAG